MKDRIKHVRKEAGLTQKEFARRLGIRQNTVAVYEMGKSGISDSVILSICREFDINEDWLRNGVEPMRTVRTKSQEIGAFANEIMDLPDDAFKKRFIEALTKLDARDWETLEKIANTIKEG